jgi:hypothetical protein
MTIDKNYDVVRPIRPDLKVVPTEEKTRSLTRRRQIRKRRLVAGGLAAATALGIGTGTYLATKDNQVNKSALANLRASAIEQLNNQGKPITQTVDGQITIKKGARFRSDSTTESESTIKFSDIETINGVKVDGADGVTIKYPKLVSGKYVDYQPDMTGLDETQRDHLGDAGTWSELVVKLKNTNRTETRYVSISNETKEAGLVEDYGNQYLPVTKDGNGLIMAKNGKGEIIPEYLMNTTTPYVDQPSN